MILVLITAHAVSPEAAREFCGKFFGDYEMSLLPGRIRRRCAIHTADPQRLLVVQEWGSRAAWESWATSERRADRLQQLAPLLTEALKQDVYESD
jgi:heme-degrading monooxygenase HmoA